MLKRIVISVILVILTSFYLFPISFSFLPESVNSKMMMSGFGIIALLYDSMSRRSFSIPRPLLYAGIWALIFSLWCYFSITENGTDDVSYARYWISFFTWVFGGYAVLFLLRSLTGKYDLDTLTFYLALVCVSQCLLAELMDNNPGFRQVIDRYVIQGQDFMHDIKRLYGIGAALDPAGVRFSVVLVLMAHQMSSAGKAMENTALSLFYFVSFIVIVIIGSIIARTTWVGAGMGLAYMIFSYFRVDKGYISGKQLQFWSLFIGLTLLTVIISAILYRTSPDFRANLRFGFEGFFNWAETGVFRTDSTDKLNNVMWVWPTDARGWTIGYGLFENWVFSTDIGYCRFTLYCGLVGLGLFSLFFIYNGLALYSQFDRFSFLPLFLIALTFVIWMKVATDIFFIYALLYFIEQPCTSSTT